MNNTVVLCVAVLVLFYGALSFNVSRVRRKRRSDPTATEAALTKAVRAHGNASEYIPLFVAGLLYLNTAFPSTFVTGLAVAVLVCRLSHAAGMFLISTVNERHPRERCSCIGLAAVHEVPLNPSIERTSSGKLRLPAAAAHVER